MNLQDNPMNQPHRSAGRAWRVRKPERPPAERDLAPKTIAGGKVSLNTENLLACCPSLRFLGTR